MSSPLDLRAICDGVTFDAATGIWRTARGAAVAYPEGDHAVCFALEDSSFWFRHRNRCIIAALRRFPPQGPLFDVGGGNGYVARAVIDAGLDAVLLEPGPEGARNARVVRQIPNVMCATLEEAAFRDQAVSAVGMFDVLEHIEDDRGTLAQVRRILAPGGHLYLTVPAFNWLWSGSDVAAMHYRRYSKSTLLAAFREYFDVVYVTALFARLVPLFFLARTVPYAIGWRQGRSAEQSAAEHKAGGSASLLERVLAHEIAMVERGRTQAVGSTLLAVARRR